MTKYQYTHTDMDGIKTVKELTFWGIFWHFSVLAWEKVEIKLL